MICCCASGWQKSPWGRGSTGTRPMNDGDGGKFPSPLGLAGRGLDEELGGNGGRMAPVAIRN